MQASTPSGSTSVTRVAPAWGVLAVVLMASLLACSAKRPEFATLFGDEEIPLSPTDKAAVFAAVETLFPLSSDGLRFEDPICGDVAPGVEVTDLNGDGSPEVFVQWGNTCTSGMTGRSLTLLTKDSGGQYQLQFGFPALGWIALETIGQDWPDLRFGGPGFCHPVWTWQSGNYMFKCNLPEESGGCASRDSACLDDRAGVATRFTTP
ncbi:MAG: hypothetical protein KJO01_14155 [Gammaproteobacteria bacterium]|nr:hypothetical protein [Gammaproteobacteria bacterium]